jgi:hypothetical protein
MSCDAYLTSIQELVDGSLGAIRRATLEQHLATCESCRALLADLERIRDTAASLEPIRPPDRVWLQIAGRLRQEGRLHDVPNAPVRRHARWLALAASLVSAAGAGIYFAARQPGPAAPAPVTTTATSAGNAAATDSVESIETELRLAEQHYETAIQRMQSIVGSDPDDLDPHVAATLQKNVQIIDQAIAESRAALRSEPTSTPARESLFDALRQKVALLQSTIALMNEMRKGNDAGAARIVEGLEK